MTLSAVHNAARRVESSLAGSWDDFGRTINRHDVRTLLDAVRGESIDDLGVESGLPAESAAQVNAEEDLMLLASLRAARLTAGVTQEQMAVRITSADHRIRVRFDGDTFSSILHPTEDGLVYLSDSGRTLWPAEPDGGPVAPAG